LSSHLGQSEVEYRKVEMLARNEQDAENRRSHASKDKAEVVLIAYIKEDGEYLSYIDYFKNSAGKAPHVAAYLICQLTRGASFPWHMAAHACTPSFLVPP